MKESSFPKVEIAVPLPASAKPPKDDEPLLRFFEWTHLPPNLQQASYPFQNTAADIVNKLPKNSERDMALRKLLEAKDCAVRAVLMG